MWTSHAVLAAGLPPPGTVTGLIATQADIDSVTLGWDAQTDADSFQFQRSFNSGASWSSWLAAGTGTVLLDDNSNTGLVRGATITYRMRSIKGTQSSDPSATDAVVMDDLTAPIASIEVIGNTLRVTWTDQDGGADIAKADQWEVRRGTDGTNFSTIATVGTLIYDDDLGDTDIRRYYEIRAKMTSGDTALVYRSDPSNTVTALTEPEVGGVGTVTVTRNDIDAVDVAWSAASQALTYQYRVEIDDGGFGAWTSAGGATSITLDNAGAGYAPGSKVDVEVRGKNGAATGSASVGTVTLLTIDAVTGFGVTIGFGDFTIAWTAPVGGQTPDNFRIQQSTDSITGPWSNFVLDTVSPHVHSPGAGVEQWFRVAARYISARTALEYLATYSAGDGGATLIAAPTSPAALQLDIDMISFGWVASEGAASYEVRFDQGSGFGAWSDVGNRTSVGITDGANGLDIGATVDVEVRAVNGPSISTAIADTVVLDGLDAPITLTVTPDGFDLIVDWDGGSIDDTGFGEPTSVLVERSESSGTGFAQVH